jgi:branched-chain amino acid transport system permease protein
MGSLFLQAIVSGLLMGGVYSLMATGLTLIFGVMKVVNLAHGEMMMLGMAISYWLFTLVGIDPYLSIPVSIFLLFLLGFLIQRFLINPILNASEHMQILVTLGVSLILTNSALLLWGPNIRSVTTGYSLETLWIGEIVLDLPRVVAFLFALFFTFLLYLLLRKTELGKAIRASADNPEAALLVGIEVNRIYPISFGIGAACVGAAGSLIIPFYDLTPHVGPSFTMIAFTIIIFGGMGSLSGALIGGLLVGMAESVGAVLLSSSLKSVVSMTLLVLVLLFKPRGLFGK